MIDLDEFMVPLCACGCGRELPKQSGRGRPRKYLAECQRANSLEEKAAYLQRRAAELRGGR